MAHATGATLSTAQAKQHRPTQLWPCAGQSRVGAAPSLHGGCRCLGCHMLHGFRFCIGKAATALQALPVPRLSITVTNTSTVLLMQVALGIADGGVLLFDVAAAAVTARLAGFRGDVQSLAWARFQSSAPGQPGGSAAGPAAGSTDGRTAAGDAEPADGSSVSPVPGADASGATAASSERSDAVQQASVHLNGHAATPALDTERAAAAAQQATDSPPGEAADIEAARLSGGVCNLLAAGARDGSIHIWDCRCLTDCRHNLRPEPGTDV